MGGKPRSCRGIDHAPQRVEMLLAFAGNAPRIVAVVIPGTRSTVDIAGSVGLAHGFDPQIGVEQGYAGFRRRTQAKPGARGSAPRPGGQTANLSLGLVVGRLGITRNLQRTTAVATRVDHEMHKVIGRSAWHILVVPDFPGGPFGTTGANVSGLISAWLIRAATKCCRTAPIYGDGRRVGKALGDPGAVADRFVGGLEIGN